MPKGNAEFLEVRENRASGLREPGIGPSILRRRAEWAAALRAAPRPFVTGRRPWRMLGPRPGRTSREANFKQHQRRRSGTGGIASARGIAGDAVVEPVLITSRGTPQPNGLEPLIRIVFHRSIARCVGECAAVQEIEDWLDKLGLGQYAQRFAENDNRHLRSAPPDR